MRRRGAPGHGGTEYLLGGLAIGAGTAALAGAFLLGTRGSRIGVSASPAAKGATVTWEGRF